MNEQKIMDGLQDAVDAVDEPCFVLFSKGIRGETFFVENQKMFDLKPVDKSEVYCGASIGLLLGVLDPTNE